MTIAELIEFLKQQPQDMLVGYKCYSEYVLLDARYITIKELCEARRDGWIHAYRPDKKAVSYLLFPGN